MQRGVQQPRYIYCVFHHHLSHPIRFTVHLLGYSIAFCKFSEGWLYFSSSSKTTSILLNLAMRVCGGRKATRLFVPFLLLLFCLPVFQPLSVLETSLTVISFSSLCIAVGCGWHGLSFL
uniref:Uncharacterized protein n=1 Tax=Trypanosoma vivax (strain Y486) TaxID=1055687 RepID=G0TYG6_TRYVY|nr:hypothetical protein TVY486_0703470 [Trypanosoma vivax Y486]